MSSSSSQKKTDILKEPRLPTISIDLGSSGCSVVVSLFAPENTAVSDLADFTSSVILTENEKLTRPMNDCLMYFPDGEMVPAGEKGVPFVIMRHSTELDKISSTSSQHLLNDMFAAGNGGCLGLDGEPIEISNSSSSKKIKIPGFHEVSMVNRLEMGKIKRVNNVKVPLYKWINNNSEKAPSYAGHSAHDMLKIRPGDVPLATSEILASHTSGGVSGSVDVSPSPRESLTEKKAVLVWAGLYRDFILRAAKSLLEKDHAGQKALGGIDKYLQALKVSVCLPAEGETKFPWQLSSFIFEAIELATTGFTGSFKPLADIRPRFEADITSEGGRVLAKKGSSRILICSESRAVMQYLFTQKIRDAVKNQKDWDSFPAQICAMIIDPGHGTTDVSIVILDKATLNVIKHARADFGESVGGKDIDDHFESLVVKPFLEGMREYLRMDAANFNLKDFKIKNEGLEKKWRGIKERWYGNESSNLKGGGLATLSFDHFKQYLQNKGITSDKFSSARKAGLARVLEGKEIKNLMKKVGGIEPPPCVSFYGQDGEDMILDWQLLKACFDKMFDPLRAKMTEACEHPLLDKNHKVHLLCLAGGASNSLHVRSELEKIVRDDACCAAQNMPSGIHLSTLGGFRDNVSELPCLGALVDAWLRPDDVEAVESSVAHYSYLEPNLHGKELGDKLKDELRSRDDQDGLSEDDAFFQDLDEYVSANPTIHEILIAVPMTSKGQMYCPTIDIPRYVLGSPDYTVSGKGEIFVGHIKKTVKPDQWIDGKRKIHQRFLVLPKGDVSRHKEYGYYKKALRYNPKDPVYMPTSAEASVLRLTMDKSGHFHESLLDLNTGATSGLVEQTRGRTSRAKPSKSPESPPSSSSGIGGNLNPLSGQKRSRDSDDTEDEDVGPGVLKAPKASLVSSCHSKPSRRSHRAPPTKCKFAGQRGYCSMLAPPGLWWHKEPSGAWIPGPGNGGEKYCAGCHSKLVAQESRSQLCSSSPSDPVISSSSDDEEEKDEDDDAEALIHMRYNSKN
jgi:hypothetical protein